MCKDTCGLPSEQIDPFEEDYRVLCVLGPLAQASNGDA